jgi:hypothetical protein
MALLVLRGVGPDSYRDVGQNQMCHLRGGNFFFYVVSLICSLSLSFRLAPNGFGLCEGGDFYH